MGRSAVELVLFFIVIVFGMGYIVLNYFDLLLFTLVQVLGIAAAMAGIVYVIESTDFFSVVGTVDAS